MTNKLINIHYPYVYITSKDRYAVIVTKAKLLDH